MAGESGGNGRSVIYRHPGSWWGRLARLCLLQSRWETVVAERGDTFPRAAYELPESEIRALGSLHIPPHSTRHLARPWEVACAPLRPN